MIFVKWYMIINVVNYNLRESVFMKAYIDRDGCISCGQCADICPEVFFIAEDGLAGAKDEIPSDCEGRAVEAQEVCPVSVITVED